MVIAIIALLMAILMPALSMVKKQAQATVCMANLHQWALVFQMYTDDNNGHFSTGYCARLYNGIPHDWFATLLPYYKNRDLCLCPSATRLATPVGSSLNPVPSGTFTAWGQFPDWYGMKDVYGSYGLNECVSNPLPGYPTSMYGDDFVRDNWKTPNVRGADKIPLLLDCVWMGSIPYNDTDAPPEFNNFFWDSFMARFCMPRHKDHINGLFVDFSVRKVDLKELWVLKWHRTFNTNGPWTRAGGVMPDDWPQWMRIFTDY